MAFKQETLSRQACGWVACGPNVVRSMDSEHRQHTESRSVSDEQAYQKPRATPPSLCGARAPDGLSFLVAWYLQRQGCWVVLPRTFVASDVPGVDLPGDPGK